MCEVDRPTACRVIHEVQHIERLLFKHLTTEMPPLTNQKQVFQCIFYSRWFIELLWYFRSIQRMQFFWISFIIQSLI